MKKGGRDFGEWLVRLRLVFSFPGFAGADEDMLFLFLGVFLEGGEAFGAEAEFLLHTGVRVIGIEKFLEQDEDVELGALELDLGVVVHGELGVGAADADGAHGVDAALLRQGLVEVEDPGFEVVVDAHYLLAGLEHGGV